MVEVQSKGSSSNFAPAGVNAFTEEWQPSQKHCPRKESQPLSCPECASVGPFDKAGTRQTAEGLTLQRYYCKDCNLRFSEPNPFKLSRTNSDHQLGVILKDAKKLDPQQKNDVVAISQNQTHQTTIQGEIVDFLWYMKKQGKFSDATIKTRVKLLRYLSEKNGVNLHDPEAVRTILATNEKWTNGYKQNFVSAYDSFAGMLRIVWAPPYYEIKKTLPFVPTEKEVEALIVGCSKKIGTCLLALKETGFRIGELWGCKWTDLDEENFTLKCVAEKHGNPRQEKISARLMSRLLVLPKTNQYIFGNGNLNAFRWKYDRQKHALSIKEVNPRLKQVKFHSLRHFYASKLYAQTRNILLVQEKCGHRNINSTLVYTHLVPIDDEAENYHHATAKDSKEAGELIEQAWQYVLTTPQGVMMFRKAKKRNE
jgi:integrase/transposase-like protein